MPKSTSSISPIDAPNEAKDDNGEKQWSNRFQFILSAIGLAVGLGNVWRFPGLAYENGGSAFLIPYITSGFIFGLPVIYAEFIIGQFTQANPAKAFYMYAPAFHGVGFLVILISIGVSIYYAVVIGWAMLYLALTIGAQSHKWTRCDNFWNTPNCISSEDNVACFSKIPSLPYAFNGTCVSHSPPNTRVNGAQEFFKRYVTPRSEGIMDFGDFNYPVLGCLGVLYVLCAFTNIRGVKILGKMSYITVPLPYIVVLILFIRGLFLDGAMDGVKHYLFNPDMSKLLDFKTWVAALNQTCFSLALGMGGLISLASHNNKRNNCFRDALTVIIFDTLMSVIGGLAVFSILGYLAKQTGREINDVVDFGPSLVFVVYPEAIATMYFPWLWNLLFFSMLFFLGFSAQVALIELLCGFVHTTFSSIKKLWITPIIWVVILYSSAIIMTTAAGWYWFNLMDGFVCATSPFVAVFFEVVLLAYVYGWRNVSADMDIIFGSRPKNIIWYLFSKQSPYFALTWFVICPILASVAAFLSIYERKVPMEIKLSENNIYPLPIGAEIFGWFICLGPLLAVPICLGLQIYRLKKKGLSLTYLLRPSKEHPSHDRIYRNSDISPPEGYNDEDGSSTTRTLSF